MISWMQRNNKYLVITIWVAVIAFIGAGAVNWGNMNFGSASNSVAKVGDIPIKNIKYSYSYNNLYLQYAQQAQQEGKVFDKETAKKMHLGKKVLDSLIQQTLLLNLAKEYGIITTDEEVGKEIVSYQAFQDKNGQFSKEIYDNFLNARGLKAKDFEAILKDEITVNKLLKLLNVKPLNFEKESIGSAFKVADKIDYQVLKYSDVNISLTDDELKQFWQKNKSKYLTPKKYSLELLWTYSKDVNLTDKEIEEFYNKNSFNYLDDKGNVKKLADVKKQVIKDLKLKKIKKLAAIARSRFKKGKIKAAETVLLTFGDKKLSTEIWKDIKNAKEGEYLKPKAVDANFVTVHLKNIIKPKEMSFEEAKELVKKDLKKVKAKKKLNKLADELIKGGKFAESVNEYITPFEIVTFNSLTPQESFKAVKTIFNGNKDTGKVEIESGLFVYKIVDQKLKDSNKSVIDIDNQIAQLKNSELFGNLFNELSKRYKVISFAKDIQ